MKTFISNTKGVWKEILPITLTEEEKTYLESNDKESIPNGQEILDGIKARKEQDVTGEQLTKLTKFYDFFELGLSKRGIDSFELISVDINENFKGIINYRVGKEHFQQRYR